MAVRRGQSKPNAPKPRAPRTVKGSPRVARVGDVMQLLTDPTVILREIAMTPRQAQLSLPVDGKGAVIKVSVKPGAKGTVPATITVPVAGVPVTFPLLTEADFQEYQL